MRILLVEDERKFGSSVSQGLSESGFAVDWMQSGEDGLSAFGKAAYDIVILDIMLPGRNGLEVLAEIRKISDTPVLMLTASDLDENRGKAIALGANYYLPKPVSFQQLLAKIACFSKAAKEKRDSAVRAAGIEIDRNARQISRDGVTLELSRREYDLLLLLVDHYGSILPHELISQHVWGMSSDSDRSVVELAVRRLNERIDAAFGNELIEIIPGAGYALKRADTP